jgi:hypothetical protein
MHDTPGHLHHIDLEQGEHRRVSGARGTRQRRVLASNSNPEELVPVQARVPARLRAKVHEAAAAMNLSTSAYLELVFEQLEVPERPQIPLPLAESA